MRLIDADVLIDDLKHDVAMDQDSLDYEELTDSNREIIQFDKDCKQNAIDLLQNAPTIKSETNCSEFPNNWIPCSEKLPEESGLYIVTNVGRCGELVETRYYYIREDGNFWGGHQSRKVLAWMPLPASYRKEGEE